MIKLWKSLAPVMIGALALTLLLTTFAYVAFEDSPEAQAASMVAAAPARLSVVQPDQIGLSPERAQHYDSLLQKLAPSAPHYSPPSLESVLQYQRQRLGHHASEAQVQAAAEEYYAQLQQNQGKIGGANPLAYLGRLKAQEMAAAAGSNTVAALTGNPEVLTVMLNFDGVETYDTSDPVAFNGNCLTDTAVFTPGFQVVIDGPQFNEIPEPDDNSTPWLDPTSSPTDGFTKEYYDLFMYSTTGDTSLMRPDLPNPWTGGNGYDFGGVSFQNYYVENSRGVYTPQGEVVEVAIPKAVSYFGAAACNGVYQDNSYNGVDYTIAISAAQQINTEFPGAATGTNSDFSWAEWDKEDIFDYDNDGDFFEPDGYVDHFFLIEAGKAEDGEYEEFMIWPHSWAVDFAAPGVGPTGNQQGGYQVATDNDLPFGSIWVLNYTVSDEVGGLGTLVHEYGHDIGLPDNYGTDGSGPNPGFWDVMSAGGFGGGLGGMQPSHMTIWDKEFLGWNSPEVIDVPSMAANSPQATGEYTIGQQSKPPAGTLDGLRINLPDVVFESSVEPFGDFMWWSDQGDMRSESIVQTLTVQAGESVTVTAALAYDIEVDYDYLYWEISSSITGTWIPLEVFSGTTELTTDEDPNDGNTIGNGITGSSEGEWLQANAVITSSAHSGGDVLFRFRYQTDPSVQGEGVYLDNIVITGSLSGELFSDDAEGADRWAHTSDTPNNETPWRLFNGVQASSNYYLVEWRNSGEESGVHGNSDTTQAFEVAGFDIGLNRMYWFSSFDDVENSSRIDPFFMHTPGMLVWYVNERYGSNDLFSNYNDDPSFGPKGLVLLVDANPFPYTVPDPEQDSRLVTERRSAFDGAFTLDDRPALTLTSDMSNTGSVSTTLIPGGYAKPAFHDRIGSFPGAEGEDGNLIDADAGVVLPTADSTPYWPAWDEYGDTGNPGLEALGVNLEVLEQADDGTWGRVRFYLDDDTIFFDKRASVESAAFGEVVTFTLHLKDASGTRYADDFSYTYPATMTEQIPVGTTYVPGSLTVTDGPWTAAPSTAVVTNSMVIWNGVLGGNPVDTLDAVIQYAVTIGAGANVARSAFESPATLQVEQIQIDTDTFGNLLEEPYLWPKHTTYHADTTVTVVDGKVYFPIIGKQNPNQ